MVGGQEVDKMQIIATIKSGVFGVPPHTLEMVTDYGLRVPKCIVLLKDNLIELDAWKEEGIFRIAGSISVMNKIKGELNSDFFKSYDDPYSLSTLLKVTHPFANNLTDSFENRSGLENYQNRFFKIFQKMSWHPKI